MQDPNVVEDVGDTDSGRLTPCRRQATLIVSNVASTSEAHRMTQSHGPKYERRYAPRSRLSAGCSCWLFAPPDFHRRQVTVLDAARGGLGLILPEPLPVGASVAVRPDGPIDPDQVVGLLVRHATPQPDGLWLVGCSFSRGLSDEMLRALLEALRPVEDHDLVGG